MSEEAKCPECNGVWGLHKMDCGSKSLVDTGGYEPKVNTAVEGACCECGAQSCNCLVKSDFDRMVATGYACGLTTLGEAYRQTQSHYDAFFKIEEAPFRLNQLERFINTQGGPDRTIRELKGDDWCAREDLGMATYFAACEAVPDEDEDWLSGVTCNPDAPEECESCQ